MKPNNLVGQRFNRLVVTYDAGRNKKKNIMWGCVCDCGGAAVAPAYELRAGKVTSCGCRNREGPRPTHGLTHTPIYNVWATMVQRCTNPNDRNWDRYGGRGIDLDPKWLRFESFFADMGSSYAPGLTLDRENNSAGYSKNNCRWVTHAQQSRNKRSTVFVDVDGVRMAQIDAAEALGVTYASIWSWRKQGMSDTQIVERARWLVRKRGLLRAKSRSCSKNTVLTTPCP